MQNPIFIGHFQIGTYFAANLVREESILIMSILNFRNTLKGLALASVFTFGLILVSSTNASAQYGGYYPNYPNNGGYGRDNDRYRRNERKDYERGYKQGYKDGKEDARHRRGRYGRNDRNGNGGYGYGAYQAGYQRGYRDGYDRNKRGIFNGRWPF
jgi:hypothetical protein